MVFVISVVGFLIMILWDDKQRKKAILSRQERNER
jgi:hypothetical protein